MVERLESERLKRYQERLWANNQELGQPDLTPERLGELRAQNLIIKKILGKDIRTEEDYLVARAKLFDDLEVKSPGSAEFLAEPIRWQNKKLASGRIIPVPTRRIDQIKTDVETGRIFNRDYKLS